MSERKVCHACVSMPRDFLCGVCDAPAEDVRAVGDEPVAFQWRRKTVMEGSQWTRWVDCTADDYSAVVASPGPSDIGIIREARKLYLHPQRQVVLPERRTAESPEINQNGPLWWREEKAADFNACLDEIERLNK